MIDELQNSKLMMLGKLAATFSHEIRSPLSVLKLNLFYLKTYANLNENEVIESIQSCEEAIERINILVENILEFTRKADEDLEETSLNQILEKASQILKSKLNHHSIKLVKHFDDGLPKLSLNKNKILQVALNLITNAIEASEIGNKIFLKTYTSQTDNFNYVIFEVEDHGKGISDDNKNKIFKEFFTDKKSGTGIGLNYCRNVLLDFNAEIFFESTLNVGTKFFVKFPLVKKVKQ